MIASLATQLVRTASRQLAREGWPDLLVPAQLKYLSDEALILLSAFLSALHYHQQQMERIIVMGPPRTIAEQNYSPQLTKYLVELAFVRYLEHGCHWLQPLSESSPLWQQVPAEAALLLLPGAVKSKSRRSSDMLSRISFNKGVEQYARSELQQGRSVLIPC